MMLGWLTFDRDFTSASTAFFAMKPKLFLSIFKATYLLFSGSYPSLITEVKPYPKVLPT